MTTDYTEYTDLKAGNRSLTTESTESTKEEISQVMMGKESRTKNRELIFNHEEQLPPWKEQGKSDPECRGGDFPLDKNRQG